MYAPKSFTASATLTPSDATGSGYSYKIVVGTTVTSNDYIVQVANGDDIMTGLALSAADGGNTVNGWETASTSDTITMDGSTTGGLKGDVIELIDCANNTWSVQMRSASTGTEATPFSAAVS